MKNKRCHIGTKVQSLIFDKDKFHGNVMKAKEWLTKHGYKTSVDEKEHTWHFRQEEPTEFKDDSFRTIQLKDGIKAAIACPIHKFARGGNIDNSHKLIDLGIKDTTELSSKYKDFLDKVVEKNDLGTYVGYQLRLSNNTITVIGSKGTYEAEITNYKDFPKSVRGLRASMVHFEEGGSIDERTKLSKEAKEFVPEKQLRIINTSDEFEDVREDLNRIVAATPKTYATEHLKREDKIAYLHYFTGNSDWFILEKDAGSGSDKRQMQAFGFVILNGDWEYSELGYINLEEVKKYAELDLYFEPKLLTEALKGIGGKKVAEDVREAEKEFTLEEVNKLNKDELATEYKAKWDVEAGHQDYNTLATAIILGKRIKHVTSEDIQKYIDDTNAHLAEKVANEEAEKTLALEANEKEEYAKYLTGAHSEIEEDKKGNEEKIAETEHAIEAITELLPTLKGKAKKEAEVELAKLTHELETVKMEHGGWVGKDVAFKSGTGFKNFVVKKYKGGIYELKGLGHSGEMFATGEELEERFAHQKMEKGGNVEEKDIVSDTIKTLAKQHNGTYNFTLDEKGGYTLNFDFTTPEDKTNFINALNDLNDKTLKYENGGEIEGNALIVKVEPSKEIEILESEPIKVEKPKRSKKAKTGNLIITKKGLAEFKKLSKSSPQEFKSLNADKDFNPKEAFTPAYVDEFKNFDLSKMIKLGYIKHETK